MFAPVRARTLAVQVHGAGRPVAAATVNQWRRRRRRTSAVTGRRRFRVTGRRHRVHLGTVTSRIDTIRHRLVVHDVLGQCGLVVDEVHRRGGYRGRRGCVVDQRRFETGGRRPGTQHEAHHRYGKVEREQDELSVKSEKIIVRFNIHVHRVTIIIASSSDLLPRVYFYVFREF